MKFTNPDTPRAPVRRVANLPVLIVLSIVLLSVLAAAADTSADACTASRARALEALARAANDILQMLDTDAAVDGAPEYELQQAQDGQMAEIERARRDVEERFRRCVAEAGSPR
jgi:hypothetical protein